jgi:uncharacterized protein (TIGR01777 family)
MKVLLTGSSGLIGSELIPFLRAAGHSVTRLVRRPAHEGGREIAWNPSERKLDPAALDGFDAAIHLAGENLSARRWSTDFKNRVRDSRVQSTSLLCSTLARLNHPPKVIVTASAIGFYGSQREEALDESSAGGKGFLAELCRAWEAATEVAADNGIRVVNLRIGFVLSAAGGGLAKMLTPFNLGFGGRVGSGNQVLSWIALDDLVEAIHFVLTREQLLGPVNAAAPSPVSNAEFTRTLGGVLGRPTIFPLPAFAARLLFGEMADELVLASQRVVPAKLLGAGFKFEYPELALALRHVLGR